MRNKVEVTVKIKGFWAIVALVLVTLALQFQPVAQVAPAEQEDEGLSAVTFRSA